MKKLLLFTALASLLALSCAKEVESPQAEKPAKEEQVDTPVSYHSVTLSATKADDDDETKSAYGEDKYFTWSDGDQISVLFHNGATHKFYTFTIASGGSKSGTFTCDSVEDGYEIGSSSGVKWALYPASTEHVFGGSSVSFYVPAVTDQTSHESANIPMAYKGTDGDNLTFHHIAGCYKFTFTGLDVSTARLIIRTKATHQLSGLFPLTVNGSDDTDIYWEAVWAEDGSGEQTYSVVKNVAGDGSVTFYIPCGEVGETEFQPIVILKDEATGNMLLRSEAKVAFASDALKPLRSRMVVLPSVAAPGSGVPLLSKFGIDWSSVSEAADAYKGITVKGYSPDSDYLYLYLEVDHSSLDTEPSYGFANQLNLFLGNEGSSSTDWKWSVAPNTYSWDGTAAWLTKAGVVGYKNRVADLVLDYNYNGCTSKNAYELKLARYPIGDYSFLYGSHTAHVGAVVFKSLRDGGGDWNTYNYSPKKSMLEVNLPGADSTPAPSPSADVDLAAAYSNREVYTENTGFILNPERGFYKNAGNFTSSSSALSSSAVEAARAQGYSLMYIAFYLTGFETKAISDDYLSKIRTSLSSFAGTGVKCILRFAYSNGHDEEDDRPWDASESWIKYHIGQLEDIIADYKKDILVVQAGFIGSWGEWYYTESFGGGGDFRYIHGDEGAHAIDFTARKAVVDELLSSVPSDRQVALRTPQFKMRMYGTTALNSGTAHDGSAISRLAGHNDCFGASNTDSGTFGNESGDRDFWKADSKYVLMGGESCKVSSYCLCNQTLQDLEDYHWTYLNNGYHTDVLHRWKNDGCYTEIMNRLGYRLVIMDSYYTLSGSTLSLAIRINNKGFAAPQNPRNAKLVFVPSAGAAQTYDLGSDPRTWHSGVNVIETSIVLPSTSGTLYLSLSDPDYSANPLYSIACANTGVFESATGYNKLLEL